MPRPNRGRLLGLALAAAVAAAMPGGLSAHAALQDPEGVEPYGGDVPERTARVWLDRGEEPLLARGERARVYYRSSHDAFVAIFQIDTNGSVRLVFPRAPQEDHYVRGGRDYRLLFPRSPYWLVDDAPGVGYFFIVASPEPFDFRALEYSYFDRGWDLSRVGRSVYQDPYVAMDDYVAALVPDWEYLPYALDFSAYHVGEERYDYPRFLCYDCHEFRPYSVWNPYLHACTSFRVVVYDDPYYYPATRYRADRVVYARPPIPFQPRFEFKERAGDAPSGPEYVTRGPPAEREGIGSRGVLRRSRPEGAPGTPRLGTPWRGGEPGARPPGGSALPRRSLGPEGPEPLRRPTGVLPGPGRSGAGSAAPPLRRSAPRAGDPGGRRAPPVLERRTRGGDASGSGGEARPRTRPPVRSTPPRTGSGGGTDPVRRPSPRRSGGTAEGGAPARANPGEAAGRPSGQRRVPPSRPVRSSRPRTAGGMTFTPLVDPDADRTPRRGVSVLESRPEPRGSRATAGPDAAGPAPRATPAPARTPGARPDPVEARRGPSARGDAASPATRGTPLRRPPLRRSPASPPSARSPGARPSAASPGATRSSPRPSAGTPGRILRRTLPRPARGSATPPSARSRPPSAGASAGSRGGVTRRSPPVRRPAVRRPVRRGGGGDRGGG